MNITATLAELADLVDGKIIGDPSCVITGLGTLPNAKPGQISFLDNPQYRKYLNDTQASAVILAGNIAEQCLVNALVVANPYYAYATIARQFLKLPDAHSGVHPTAVVDPSADIDETAHIGPYCVIGANVKIAANVIIGPHCCLGDEVTIGESTRLWANVSVYYSVKIGSRTLIHSGVVLGADGFGIAKHAGKWTKVPQLGALLIGDDVDIGANTTIDRGAIEDTMIGNDVKIDNLCQIGHNVSIGDHTAIAGCSGVSGSTHIGRDCLVGGGAGFAGHLNIADNVSVVGRSTVAGSIETPGVY